MKMLLTNFLLLLAAFVSVFPFFLWQRKSGALDSLLRWWRGVSNHIRAVVLTLFIFLAAFGGSKDAGNGLMGMFRNFRVAATNTFSAVEQTTGYALSLVGTNEVHDFTMPTNAVVADRIAKRGAHDDGFWTQDGALWIHTDGTASYAGARSVAPLVFAVAQGSYGFLPEALWGEYGEV